MKKFFNRTAFDVVLAIVFVFTVLSLSANADAKKFDIPINSAEIYSEGDSYMYSGSNLIRYTNSDFKCLVANIYHEARNQPTVGQIMVASATFNRLIMKDYPNTICDVVKQNSRHKNGKLKNGGCAFSWVCDNKSDKPNLSNPLERKAWTSAINTAVYALKHDTKVLDMNVTHYHTKSISPHWAGSLTPLGEFGDHLAYAPK